MKKTNFGWKHTCLSLSVTVCIISLLVLIFKDTTVDERSGFDLSKYKVPKNNKVRFFSDPPGAEIQQDPTGDTGNTPPVLGHTGLDFPDADIDSFVSETRDGVEYVSFTILKDDYYPEKFTVKKDVLRSGAFPDKTLRLRPKSKLKETWQRQTVVCITFALSALGCVVFGFLYHKDVRDFQERDRLLGKAGSDGYIGRFVGDYLIREHITSEGAGGHIYLARDKNKQKVAVKIFINRPPDRDSDKFKDEDGQFLKDKYKEAVETFENLRDRFRRESVICNKVSHPNVGSTLAHGEEDDFLWLAMPYYKQGDLRKILSKGSLSPDRVLQYSEELAEGLNAIHRLDIVHRDLKPENVMLSGDRLVVIDFGLAKDRGEKDNASLTGMGDGLGTPLYMMPQSGYEAKFLGVEADQYSYGYILFEFLTGRLPVPRDLPPMEVLMLKIEGKISSLTDVDARYSKELETVVSKISSKDPLQQYPSVLDACEAFKNAYKAWLESSNQLSHR